MGKSANDILKGLSKDRQARIQKQADTEIREYYSLQSFRKTIGMTQSEMAELQGIKQVNISNLEKRDDMLLSTLRKFVESLDCELEIIIRKPDNTNVRMDLAPRHFIPSIKNAPTGEDVSKGVVRRRSQVKNPKTGLYAKRDPKTGKFMHVKSSGKESLKRVRKKK